MKILILDDEQARHDIFAERYRGHDVWHAHDVSRFRRLIHEGDWDIVSLDHDLGTHATGFDAALEITGRVPAEKWPALVIVHSWNPSGGARMFDVLHQNGVNVRREPFSGKP